MIVTPSQLKAEGNSNEGGRVSERSLEQLALVQAHFCGAEFSAYV
ncbi:hypothetical protein [Pseudolysobacter antarcticus]|nr:hypothetical protein [Pseudolysobacter antarcticus]